jgi:hypothetical protein
MKIQAGHYYWNYWLRYVSSIHKERVLLVDFTGPNTVSRTHFMRWAKEELTPDQAREKYPKEYAEINDLAP